MEAFAATWLRLREPYDHAARSAPLARRFLAALPAVPRVLDLAAGAGSNARYLASLGVRPANWVLADADRALLAAAAIRTAHAERMAVDLARAGPGLDLTRIDGVTAAAFGDLVSAAWLARFARRVAQFRLPVLMALSVDGRAMWTPEDADDVLVQRLFRRDQARDKGFGPALGGAAPWRMASMFRGYGYRVHIGYSDWRIGPQDRAMHDRMIDGFAAAATAAAPGTRDTIADWSDRRRAQAAAGLLHLSVGHRDCLALPPPDSSSR
jgi:SAM-dependent methyltransferase